jgi:hypothetical protein
VANTIACPDDVPTRQLPKPSPEAASYSQTLKGNKWQSNALRRMHNACEMGTVWDMAKRKSKHIATNITRIEAPPKATQRRTFGRRTICDSGNRITMAVCCCFFSPAALRCGWCWRWKAFDCLMK